jgi:hypothetical protein
VIHYIEAVGHGKKKMGEKIKLLAVGGFLRIII